MTPAAGLLREVDTEAWVLGKRQELSDRLSRRVRLIVSRLMDEGDLEQSIELAEFALETPLSDEHFYAGAISGYLKQGKPSLALQIYERYRAALAANVMLSPSTIVEALHTEILQANITINGD